MVKVLVIEDEKAVRKLVGRMLESRDHTMIEASDGVQGLQAFQEEKPDVVVTDIIMPNADGLEVIRKIMEWEPEAKIIAISGGGRVEERTYLNYAKKFGAQAILAKPFEPDELLSLIESLSEPMPPVSAEG